MLLPFFPRRLRAGVHVDTLYTVTASISKVFLNALAGKVKTVESDYCLHLFVPQRGDGMHAANALVCAVLTVVAMVSSEPTHALSIPVPTGATPSSDLIINFDYGAAGVHPGPYVSVDVFLGFNPPFAGSTVAIDLFGDLNGVDLLDSTVTAPFFSTTNVYQVPGVFDGVFSIGVRVTAGTAELDFANSLATWISIDNSTNPPTTTFGTTGEVTGQIVTNPGGVPEPSTLALMTIALGTGARRAKTISGRSDRPLAQGPNRRVFRSIV